MGGKQKATKEKPLEKMTAKELRELAGDIPEITGVHGMNKIELISAIKKVRGIEDTTTKKDTSSSVREIKKKIKKLKAEREKLLEKDDAKMAAIYRKRIIRLKKKSRRAA